MDAKEDTIAAVNAAKAKPFIPGGNNFNNQGYALSDLKVSKPAVSFIITYAAIPGKTTIKGIINFKPAANKIPF